jgi:hypothetical protein
MSNAIFIVAEGLRLRAELDDTPSARAIFEALPIEAHGNRWGEEFYFDIAVDEPLAPDAVEEVEIGDLGYWPPGKAFCVFFGRTPASTGENPRAASPVNLIGRVLDDATALKDVPHGAAIKLETA